MCLCSHLVTYLINNRLLPLVMAKTCTVGIHIQVFKVQPAYARDLWDTGPALATNLQDVQLTCKQAADGMRRDSSNAQLLGGLSGKAALFPSLLISRKDILVLSGIVGGFFVFRSSRSFVLCLTSHATTHSLPVLSHARGLYCIEDGDPCC